MIKNRPRLALPLALGALALALGSRWAEAWNQLPDLEHAWLVPALAAYLAWERRRDQPAPSASLRLQTLAFSAGLLAVTYVAGRVLLAPFPAWPAALWLFSLSGWGLALALVTACAGPGPARHFAFPILFTGTALPWFTVIDVHLILPLRTGLASVAAELIHALGYPATAEGTVITVGRGLVGVDEACGGVRSLQSGIMVALFFGELLRLKTPRRLALIAIAIALALLSNLGRTCFLAWQAAAQGPAAAERWHDPAGWTQLLIALGGLALVASFWSRFTPVPKIQPASEPARKDFTGWRPLFALVSLLIFSEIAVSLWFKQQPAHSTAPGVWSVALPVQDPSYEPTPFAENVRNLLRCDDYQAGRWQTPEGGRRAGYVLTWRRGEVARDIIALHNPEICLPGGGSRLLERAQSELVKLSGGTILPFSSTTFEERNGPFYVFYLAWDQTHARALAPANDTGWRGWWAHRLGEVAARRARFEACVIALAYYDQPDATAARAAFSREASHLFASPETDL